MKRFSNSQSHSHEFPNAADASAPRSHERGAGVPPSHTQQQKDSSPAVAASSSPHTSSYYSHSPPPAADHAIHHHASSSAYHDDGVDAMYRDLGHAPPPLSGLHSGGYQESPVFRSVSMLPTEHSWMDDPAPAPNGNGHLSADKNAPWMGTSKLGAPDFIGFSTQDTSPKDSFSPPPSSSMSMMPPSLGGSGTTLNARPGTGVSLDMPTLAQTGVSGSSLPPMDGITAVAGHTTLEALQAVCESFAFTAPQPLPFFLEPYSNFDMHGAPRDIALAIGSYLTDSGIVFAFQPAQCVFECQAQVSGHSVTFNVTVFSDDAETSDAAADEGNFVVEFQRRWGDCMQFGALYRAAHDSLTDAGAKAAETADAAAAAAGDVQDGAVAVQEDIGCSPSFAIPPNEFAPGEAVPAANASMLATLSEMINSEFFEVQYEAAATVARLSVDEANCRYILGHEASLNALIASLKEKRDPRVQRSAVTSVANLASHSEHVPGGSLNVLVVALIAVLLLSSSIDMVRETARALVALADRHQEFDPNIHSAVGGVLEKLASTHDEVAIGYRNELVRKVPAISI